MSEIKIMLVDDQVLIREGLKLLLEKDSELFVIAEASNGEEAVVLAKKHNPDVILMDIRMPLMNGVEATKIIKEYNSAIKIIILTTFDDDEYIIKALSYGAQGYLLKDIESSLLIDAVHKSMSNQVILPSIVASKIISLIPNQDKAMSLNQFTRREIDIISLLIDGKNNLEIAESLFLSLGTVKNYLTQIYQKADVLNRSQAIVLFQNLKGKI